MASSTATTIQEATPAREDLDATSISSLTTVQASNKVSPGDTTANVSHNEDEKDIDTFTASGPASGAADPHQFGQPPPVPDAFVDPNREVNSGLTESEDDELDPDLQARLEATRAELRKEQRKRRIKKNKAMSDKQEKITKRRRDDDDDDDGGGDSKLPPAAGGAGVDALAVK